jgi:plastocyanin
VKNALGASVPSPLQFIAALVCLALVGCSDSSSGPPPTPVNVTPVDQSTAGSIRVEVTYNGPARAAQPINMAGTPACAALHSEPVLDPGLVVRDGHLANAVVFIKSGFGDRVFAPPSAPVVIDQKGCMYEPHVAAVMVGQGLEFRNSDQEAHNVHGRTQVADGWNFLMSRPNSTRDVYIKKPEIGIPVTCDVHPWMRAYISVLDNPYFAVTAGDGSVTLPGVPPGEYVVAVWHESLGTLVRPATVPPQGTVSLLFAFQAPQTG